MAQIADSTWAKKVTNILAGLVIFFSSTQLGLHFWPNSAFIHGVRIDYLSPTLYFLDVLIICYLVIRNCLIIDYWKLRFIVPLLLVNLFFSQNPWASLAWSLHFLLYLTFVSSLKLAKNGTLLFVLSLSLLFQTILSLIQVGVGHSLQGPLYYLGERMVSVGLPNVAVGSFMGQVVLRAYGTFSHPNILAGYSVVAALIIYRLSQSRVTITFVTALTSLIIFLSQSRAAALSFFALVIPFSLLKSLRSRLMYFVLLLSVTSYLLFAGILSRPLDLSISERLSLQQLSSQVIRAYPVFGVGANASLTRYPDLAPLFRLFQPDHNSFTLFLSWFGMVGIVCLLYQFRTLHKRVFGTLFPLIPLLFLDHYLLTSPQGLFIFLLYYHVVCSKKSPAIPLPN